MEQINGVEIHKFKAFSILVNKCSGRCNNINDPFAKLCVPDVFKDINIKEFNDVKN